MPMSWMDGMMHGWEENMHRWNIGGIGFAMSMFGIVSGMIILVSAIMLYLNPTQHQLWGINHSLLCSEYTELHGWHGSWPDSGNNRWDPRYYMETSRIKAGCAWLRVVFYVIVRVLRLLVHIPYVSCHVHTVMYAFAFIVHVSLHMLCCVHVSRRVSIAVRPVIPIHVMHQ